MKQQQQLQEFIKSKVNPRDSLAMQHQFLSKWSNGLAQATALISQSFRHAIVTSFLWLALYSVLLLQYAQACLFSCNDGLPNQNSEGSKLLKTIFVNILQQLALSSCVGCALTSSFSNTNQYVMKKITIKIDADFSGNIWQSDVYSSRNTSKIIFKKRNSVLIVKL